MRASHAILLFAALSSTASAVGVKSGSTRAVRDGVLVTGLGTMRGHPNLPVIQAGNGGTYMTAVDALVSRDWIPATEIFGAGLSEIRFACPPVRSMNDREARVYVPNSDQAREGFATFQLELPCQATRAEVLAAMERTRELLRVAVGKKALSCEEDTDRAACDVWKRYLNSALSGEIASGNLVHYCRLGIQVGLPRAYASRAATSAAPAAPRSDFEPLPEPACPDPRNCADGWIEYHRHLNARSDAIYQHLRDHGIELQGDAGSTFTRGGKPVDELKLNQALAACVSGKMAELQGCMTEKLKPFGLTPGDFEAISEARVLLRKAGVARIRSRFGVTDPLQEVVMNYYSLEPILDARGQPTIGPMPSDCRYNSEVQAILCGN